MGSPPVGSSRNGAVRAPPSGYEVIGLRPVGGEEVMRAPEIEKEGPDRYFAMAFAERRLAALQGERPVPHGPGAAERVVGDRRRVEALVRQRRHERPELHVAGDPREDVLAQKRTGEPALARGHEV